MAFEGSTELFAGARLLGTLAAAPPFAARAVPLRMRAAAGLVILALASATVLRAPRGGIGAPEPVRTELGPAVRGPGGVAAALGAEALLGACLGGLVLAAFGAARAAAGIASDEIGFRIGGFAETGGTEGDHPLGTLQDALAVYIFFACGAHASFVRALWDGFRIVPPGTAFSTPLDAFVARVAAVGGSCVFDVAFRLALPVLGVLLLVTAVQGIVSRIIPEVELLVFGFPVRFAAGILALALCTGPVAGTLQSLFEEEVSAGRQAILALVEPGGG